VTGAPLSQARDTPWAERASGFEQAVKWLVFALLCFAIIYPFIFVLGTSISNIDDQIAGGGVVLFPQHPTLGAYQLMFSGGVVARALQVSIGITVVGTLLSLAGTTTLAYALSRPIVGRRRLVLFVLFTLLFNAGIIPNYLLVKQLGLLNTYASLILPVLINTFNLVVMRQFFMEIPQDLIDSARMDGAGELRILLRIVLPLSTAVIAVIALFYAVSYWNAFFNALLYISDQNRLPLQVAVRQFVLQNTALGTGDTLLGAATPESTKMAIVMVATIPILLVYPLLQRYFTRAVLSGAIKG